MNIELVRLTVEYKEQLFEMLTEWKNDIIANHTDMSPWKIWANDFHNFEHYMENLDTKEESKNGWVPDTTLFCLDKDRNIFVGAVNIRHYLNDELIKTGGHIGDGVRPSEITISSFREFMTSRQFRISQGLMVRTLHQTNLGTLKMEIC